MIIAIVHSMVSERALQGQSAAIEPMKYDHVIQDNAIMDRERSA
jgi:hypothetical protein